MPEKTTIEQAVPAAFEREPLINLHCFPIRVEFDAARVPGVNAVVNPIVRYG
jgi:hypothetical protein